MDKLKKIGKNVKTISKYVLNILNIINALLLVLVPIWNIPYGDKITQSLVGVAGVISTYLIGSKVTKKEV